MTDPTSRATVYACGGQHGGVFKSVDAGRHWTPARSGLDQGSASPGNFYTPQVLAIDPSRPSTLYAATQRGVFKTTDGAATWAPADTGMADRPDVWALALDPKHPTFVICGGLKTYRSVDGGEHWEEAAGPSPTAWVWTLAADPRGGGRFYAATWRGADGLYRTDDWGLTWRQLQLPAEVGCFTYSDGSTSCPYVSTVAFDPAGAFVYIATPSGVWRSGDDGLSWSPVGATTAGLWINAIAFDPGSHTVYAGSSGAGLLALQTFRARGHLRRAAPPLAARDLLSLPR